MRLFFDQVTDLAANGFGPAAERFESRIIARFEKLKNAVVMGPETLGELTLAELLFFEHFGQDQVRHFSMVGAASLINKPPIYCWGQRAWLIILY